MLDFRSCGTGVDLRGFRGGEHKHKGLWQGMYRIARLPEWAASAAPAGVHRKLLVIAEDWCGDASNTVPVVAKLADRCRGSSSGCCAGTRTPR